MSLSTPFSAAGTNRCRLRGALGLATVRLAIDLIGAALTGSLVLLAGAGHHLVSVGRVVFTLLASTFVRNRATAKRRRRYYRAAVITILLSMVALLGIVIYVLSNASHRILQRPRLDSRSILAFAAAGIAIDIGGRLLSPAGDTEPGIGPRSPFGEALALRWTSAAVVLAAVMMNTSESYLADPVVSVLLGIVIVPRVWTLLRGTVDSLVEAAPADVDVVTVYKAIRAARGVQDVHDFYLWTAGPGLNAVSAHVSATPATRTEEVLSSVHQAMSSDLNVQHLTIQVEPDGWREPKTIQ